MERASERINEDYMWCLMQAFDSLSVSSPHRYPYESDKKNVFFKHEVSIDRRSEPITSSAFGAPTWPVRIINVSAFLGDILAELYIASEKRENTSHQLFFHGTSHEGAVSILTEGSKLEKGRIRQDFSSGDGFYLSEMFENAKKWKRVGEGPHQAVVVFKVKRSLLDVRSEHGLDLSRETEIWESFVKLCRTGLYEALKNSMSRIHFIRGPICSNTREMRSGAVARSFSTLSHGLQVCVRNKSYAERFGSIENICCIIFY